MSNFKRAVLRQKEMLLQLALAAIMQVAQQRLRAVDSCRCTCVLGIKHIMDSDIFIDGNQLDWSYKDTNETRTFCGPRQDSSGKHTSLSLYHQSESGTVKGKNGKYSHLTVFKHNVESNATLSVIPVSYNYTKYKMHERCECNGDHGGSEIRQIDTRNDNGHVEEFFMSCTEFPKTPSPISPTRPLPLPGAAAANSTTPTPTPTTPAPSPASAPTSTTSTPTPSRSTAPGQECLLHWKDMPQHLQFNPYVLTGYRPLQTVKGCMFSLFYWHNETINILTHGIPIVCILATVPALMPWENDFRFLSFCHIFGAVSPWCGSFVYHLFMNLERGEKVYYRLLKIDMLGIWISQSFGALPMITATVFCLSAKLKWSIILAYCILCLWGLYKAMTALSPWQRRLCFLLPFTMRVILTLLRALGWGGGNPDALTHVFLQDAVSVTGGAIGAMHIPEKWFPGSVDLYLNSHNIMHVLVVLAVYSMHQATLGDFEWMSKTQCHMNNSSETIDIIMDSHTDL